MKVIKEAYLWLGDKIDFLVDDPSFDKAGKAEFDKYKAQVTSSEMKVGQKKQKKQKVKKQPSSQKKDY